jgi:nucleotide-binding universal stress UspA family protein
VIDLAQFGWGGTEFLDAADLQKSIKESGEQILAQAQWRAREAGIEPVTHIIESWGDKIAAVLLDDAREWKADLIVMGTHGVGGLLHLLMGSVAEGVLKQTDVPVLLVRNPGK